MKLNKCKIGKLVAISDEKNSEGKYGLANLKGISINKVFIDSKADMDGVSLSPYQIVAPDSFAYVTVTSRNSEKITIAHNTTGNTYIVSSSYVVFCVVRRDMVLPDYLYMYFNRPEFDRYTRFNSWGSARETFSWDDLCDTDITLPSLTVQQKYADVYNAMLANQRVYERGLDDLKLTCDAYLERLIKTLPKKRIGNYITLSSKKNSDLKYDVTAVRGVSIEKKLIDTKANMENVSLSPYQILSPDAFAYVTITSRNGEKISLAHNDTNETCLVSSSYVVFHVKPEEKKRLNASYLNLFFRRAEFDRYARFNSWGSAREAFSWEEMCEVKIPIPDLKTQEAIVGIYHAYIARREINEKLKARIKDICPILIKGSLEEAKKS